MQTQLILASASPRRRELLNQIGVRFRVHAVNIDETPLLNETPEAYVRRIATEKALLAARQHDDGLPVLAADTAVIVDSEILGKPKNRNDALAMLSKLAGRTHQVYTAVALHGQQLWQALSVTDVAFRSIGADEIAAYWQTGEARDKAGAYAIQGRGAIFVQSISGSFSGVVGLPLFETAALLQAAGIILLDT
ncbi:MAG: Maf family protein [Gammaproteobacteria bacterium]